MSRQRSEFGQRMFKARTAAGMTQMDVRKALTVAQSTLSELETTAAGSSRTVEFARLYGVDAGWLATGEEASPALVLSKTERALVLAFRQHQGGGPDPVPMPPPAPTPDSPIAGALDLNQKCKSTSGKAGKK